MMYWDTPSDSEDDGSLAKQNDDANGFVNGVNNGDKLFDMPASTTEVVQQLSRPPPQDDGLSKFHDFEGSNVTMSAPSPQERVSVDVSSASVEHRVVPRSRFVASNDDLSEFMCAICSEVMVDPAETPCEHFFCRVCITVSLKTSSHVGCPICREPITGMQDGLRRAGRFFRQMHGDLLVRCAGAAAGHNCPMASVRLSNLDAHEGNCPAAIAVAAAAAVAASEPIQDTENMQVSDAPSTVVKKESDVNHSDRTPGDSSSHVSLSNVQQSARSSSETSVASCLGIDDAVSSLRVASPPLPRSQSSSSSQTAVTKTRLPLALSLSSNSLASSVTSSISDSSSTAASVASTNFADPSSPPPPAPTTSSPARPPTPNRSSTVHVRHHTATSGSSSSQIRTAAGTAAASGTAAATTTSTTNMSSAKTSTRGFPWPKAIQQQLGRRRKSYLQRIMVEKAPKDMVSMVDSIKRYKFGKPSLASADALAPATVPIPALTLDLGPTPPAPRVMSQPQPRHQQQQQQQPVVEFVGPPLKPPHTLLPKRKQWVTSVAMSSTHVFSAAWDREIQMHRLKDGRLERTFLGHQFEVKAIHYANGKLFTGSWDNTARIFDVTTGMMCRVFTHPTFVTCVTTHKDFLFTGAGAIVRAWDISRGGRHQLIREFAPVALMSSATSSGQERVNALACVSWGEDDNTNQPLMYAGYDDATVVEWSVKTGFMLRIFASSSKPVWSISVTPDGKLFTGNADSTGAIFDLVTGRHVMTLTGHAGRVNSIVVDREFVFTGSQDKTIRVWRQDDGACIGVIRGHTGFVSSICVRGDLLVTGSSDKTARVWRWADDMEKV